MELYRQGKQGWAMEVSSVRSVAPPPVHQGVGDALRTTYVPRACEMPADLAALLAKLS